MSAFDVFDGCFPTSYEVEDSLAGSETSSAQWSGGWARYSHSFRVISVIWPNVNQSEADWIEQMFHGRRGVVKTFAIVLPGEPDPLSIRFAGPPTFQQVGANQVQVRADFQEAP